MGITNIANNQRGTTGTNIWKSTGQEKWYHTAAKLGTLDPEGQQLFTSTGSNTWTVPAGVKYIHAFVVGGGGGASWCEGNSEWSGTGGGGGGTCYGNFIETTAGEDLTVIVGAAGLDAGGAYQSGSDGGDSQIKRGSTVLISAEGGEGGPYNGSGGGGVGGNVFTTSTSSHGSANSATSRGGQGGAARSNDG